MDSLIKVSKDEPCTHCGKPDWCYILANGSTVCNRGNIATGWVDSGKKDKNGAAILYPESWQGKIPKPKPIQTQEWLYNDRLGNPLVKVIRQDLDNGKKRIFQNYWNGSEWLTKKPPSLERAEIPLYQFHGLKLAMEAGQIIFVVEGEKCADLLQKLGLAATTNIQGCKSFSVSDAQDLRDYPHIVLIPDRDRPGVQLMEKWAKSLPQAKWLYPFPDKDWSDIPPDNGLDIFDWVRDRSLKVQDILDGIGKLPESLATPIKEKEKPAKRKEVNNGNVVRYYGEKNLNSKELLAFVDSELGDRLKFDEFRCKLFLDGEELKLGSDCEFWFLREFGETATDKKIYNAIVNAAKQNSFHPVHQFLEECRQAEPVSIDDLAARYFGRPEPVYNLMVRLWLISAIARMKKPGCQVDHCLVLQGGQGKGKSSWLNVLFGDFFTDSITKDNFGTANSLMVAHVVWCAELGEIDSILKSREAGQIKSFLTTKEDLMRKPYAREVDWYQRSLVFAGTVNPKRFLQDDENRRFWPVPIDDDVEIDLDLLEKERQGIFHSALLAYESGAVWWPNETEKAMIGEVLNQFLDTDAWLDLIEGYLIGREMEGVSIMEILTECLGFPEKDCKRAEQNRVSRILTHLDWTVESKRQNRKTGGSERIRKPKNKKSSKTSENSGNSGKTLTGQAFQNSPSGKDAGNSGKDAGFPLQDPLLPTSPNSETLTGQDLSRYSHYSHYDSQHFEKKPEWQPMNGQKLSPGDWVNHSELGVCMVSAPLAGDQVRIELDGVRRSVPRSSLTHYWQS